MSRSARYPVAALIGTALLAGSPDAAADEGRYLLVRRDLAVQSIDVTAINPQVIEFRDGRSAWSAVPLDECLALIDPLATTAPVRTGRLVLVDGQQIPGAAISNPRPAEEAIVWNHPWLGRMNVPLKLVESVVFVPDAAAPEAGQNDVVLVVTGDQWEGFITSLGDPITIGVESDGEFREVSIPLDRAVAITMVAPRQKPKGRRVWLRDGTVLDVDSIVLGADRFARLTGSLAAAAGNDVDVQLADIVAIRFDPDRMRPLSALRPSRIDGPPTRYELPPPRALDPGAPLNLQRLEFRGPIVVHYELPRDCRRFAASAVLPASARDWGDVELIVRDDDREVYRAHLDGAAPRASINVELRGSELTIELAPGRRGAIQDHVILERAMLLVEE